MPDLSDIETLTLKFRRLIDENAAIYQGLECSFLLEALGESLEPYERMVEAWKRAAAPEDRFERWGGEDLTRKRGSTWEERR
jgi:hypothetical protein